jgi:hypothetical protein
MTFQKKKKIYGNKKKYSVINKLLSEEKINDRFLATLNLLTLEELIAVKLEMAAKASGGNIYGIPVWRSMIDICRDATLKFALTSTRTAAEAASFLGITFSTFRDYIQKYEIKSYFDE